MRHLLLVLIFITIATLTQTAFAVSDRAPDSSDHDLMLPRILGVNQSKQKDFVIQEDSALQQAINSHTHDVDDSDKSIDSESSLQ